LLHPAGSDRVVFKVPQERKSILGTCVVLLLSLSVRTSSSFFSLFFFFFFLDRRL
jgi:hypothetical protein